MNYRPTLYDWSIGLICLTAITVSIDVGAVLAWGGL